jgi:hypothetical protein
VSVLATAVPSPSTTVQIASMPAPGGDERGRQRGRPHLLTGATMKSVLTVHGPVSITYLRNGSIRIEAKKQRPRMHLRGDELMKLIQTAARAPEPARLAVVDTRCGAL